MQLEAENLQAVYVIVVATLCHHYHHFKDGAVQPI